MTPEAAYTIVCPGCGWVGKEEELVTQMGMGPVVCPICKYENGQAPWRLLTVKELLEFPQGDYNQVDLYEFLNAIKPFLQESKNED